MTQGVRYEIDGVTVRFFPDAEAADKAAKASGPRYEVFEVDNGFFLVEEIVTRRLFDTGGRLPLGVSIQRKVASMTDAGAKDEWQPIKPERCDLCSRVARFKHPHGGLRCGNCPRPRS